MYEVYTFNLQQTLVYITINCLPYLIVIIHTVHIMLLEIWKFHKEGIIYESCCVTKSKYMFVEVSKSTKKELNQPSGAKKHSCSAAAGMSLCYLLNHKAIFRHVNEYRTPCDYTYNTSTCTTIGILRGLNHHKLVLEEGTKHTCCWMRLHKKLECSIKLIMTVVLCTLHKHLNFEFELGCCYLIKDITLHIVSAVKHILETVKLSTCI